MSEPHSGDRRWSQLVLLAVVEFLAMALWFSASAVTPAIQQAWNLSDAAATWLTISVQLGFVCGALVSAVFNLSERIPPPYLLGFSALIGAFLNVAIALVIDDDDARRGAGF